MTLYSDLEFRAEVLVDEVTVYLRSVADVDPSAIEKAYWDIEGSDISMQKAVRYRTELYGQRVPIGGVVSNRLNVYPVKERPATQFNLDAQIMKPEHQSNNYSEPKLLYTLTMRPGWSGRRIGVMEFTAECETSSNYLFETTGDVPWEVSVEDNSDLRTVGPPLVKYMVGDRVHYNRVVVSIVQPAVVIGGLRIVNVHVRPRLVYYPDDPPTPPEPRWSIRAIFKMSLYAYSSTKPFLVYRSYHEEGVEGGELLRD